MASPHWPTQPIQIILPGSHAWQRLTLAFIAKLRRLRTHNLANHFARDIQLPAIALIDFWLGPTAKNKCLRDNRRQCTATPRLRGPFWMKITPQRGPYSTKNHNRSSMAESLKPPHTPVLYEGRLRPSAIILQSLETRTSRPGLGLMLRVLPDLIWWWTGRREPAGLSHRLPLVEISRRRKTYMQRVDLTVTVSAGRGGCALREDDLDASCPAKEPAGVRPPTVVAGPAAAPGDP